MISGLPGRSRYSLTHGWAVAVAVVVSGVALAGDGLMPEIRTIKGIRRSVVIPENVLNQPMPVLRALPQPAPEPETTLPDAAAVVSAETSAANKLLQDAKQKFTTGNMDAAQLLAESARDLCPESSGVRDNAVQLIDLIQLQSQKSKSQPSEISAWSSDDHPVNSDSTVRPVGLQSSVWKHAGVDRGATSAFEAAVGVATQSVVEDADAHDDESFVEVSDPQDCTPPVTEPRAAVASERTTPVVDRKPLAETAASSAENKNPSKSSLAQPDVIFWSGMTGAMLGSFSVLTAGLFFLSQKSRGGVVQVQLDGSSEMIALVNSIRCSWKEERSTAVPRETGAVVDLSTAGSTVPLRLHQTFEDQRAEKDELDKKRTQEICQMMYQQNVNLRKQLALP